ncbi:MAG: P-II family nitrogen regulator [Clostridiales Family XIII bacterium]|jgi:nitrogen regulatory protein PII|nr:P-II family nitrogen regulator [Clostridiales Family XIII bacterium]
MNYESAEFRMIVTIVNRGYAEFVVDAAREAGAKGGTIIHARGTGVHETEKFLNISITPEKEMILTLVSKESAKKITREILEKAGLKTPGRGICFVLPVTDAVGLTHPL